MNDHLHTPGCHVDLIEKRVDQDVLEQAQLALLAIEGMGCPNCARRVHNGLVQLDGVLDVEIVLDQGLARVLYDPALVPAQLLTVAVAVAGNDGRHNYAAQILGIYTHAGSDSANQEYA